MLADRDYMRASSWSSGHNQNWTFKIIITCVVVFFIQTLFQDTSGRGNFLSTYFALSLDGLKQGFVWQLISYQFMHGGLFHILVNLLLVYFFGRPIEEALGSRNFLKLYLGAGILGGLVEMIGALFAPNMFGSAVVGASAAGLGLVAAFATLFPERVLTLLLFFIIPVSMKAKVLLWISIGMALIGLVDRGGNIADGAHLGGIAAGVLFIRLRLFQSDSWLPAFLPRFRFSKSKAAPTAAPKPATRWAKIVSETKAAPPSDAEFIAREVDPILEKISAHGIHSLTPREREILEKAQKIVSHK